MFGYPDETLSLVFDILLHIVHKEVEVVVVAVVVVVVVAVAVVVVVVVVVAVAVEVVVRNLSISLRHFLNKDKHSRCRMTGTCNKNNVVRTTRISGKSYLVSRSLSYYSILL